MRVDFVQHESPDGHLYTMEGHRFKVDDMYIELYTQRGDEAGPPYILVSVYDAHNDEFVYLREGYLAKPEDLLF